MSGHTKGPWLIKEYGRSTSDNECDHSKMYIGRRAGSFEVKVVTGEPVTSMREVAINAALIAAAPDLLEALEDLVRHQEVLGRHNTIIDKALSAIAKARGEA